MGWAIGGRWRSWILPLVALAGLAAAALHASAPRAHGRRPILLVADESTFAGLAATYALPAAQFLHEAAGAGIGALAVPEATLASLSGERPGSVQFVAGNSWLNAARTGTLPPPPFAVRASDTYVFVSDPALAAWLHTSLPATLGPHVPVTWLRMGALSVADIGAAEALVSGAPLGFQPGAFALARQAGLPVVPRLEQPFTGLGPAPLQALYAEVAGAGLPVAGVIFAGPAWLPIPGGPAQADATAAIFRTHGFTLGVVQQPGYAVDLMPPGLQPLAEQLPGAVARVQSVPTLAQVTPSETHRLAQLALSGNIGMLYLRPVVVGGNPARLTIQYVGQLAAALRAEGMAPSRSAFTPGPVPSPWWIGLLQAAGAASLALWLFGLLSPGGPSRVATAAAAALAVLYAVSAAAGWEAATAQVAAFGLGAYAVRWLSADAVEGGRRGRAGSGAAPLPGLGLWFRAALAAAGWAAMAVAAGALAAGSVASSGTVLGWAYWGGQGLVHRLVPLAAALAFAAAVAPDGLWASAWRLWRSWSERHLAVNGSLRVGHVAAAIVALGVLYYLHKHGGHFWVYHVRAPWQAWAFGRWALPPSESAVLLGFPAAFLAVWCGVRRHPYGQFAALVVAAFGLQPLAAVATIPAQPLWLALVSAGWGTAFGLAAGSLALGIAALCAAVWQVLLRAAAAAEAAAAGPDLATAGAAAGAVPAAVSAARGTRPRRAPPGDLRRRDRRAGGGR